uniref:BRCA2-interacting transcriptional repressor EMSY isoform X2 n=1 Tax=Ciona intestinalis TaxID=7719 RepID=UPI00089DD58A|nr:BRCA2-interacting transcriptional repressor EMSY isoform X2 [Ciona intestinalis]|eukprot:XP_018667631.1 BRCA2-interacting transcriptional repressor EMSY isoform X2 [Ciona intestinalis]
MPPVKCSEDVYSFNERESLLKLRQYEFEAYASAVSALRAEGELNDEKRDVLAHLQRVFGITKERHKAEVRRAVNDEKLSSVSYSLNGEKSSIEWEREGQRITPLPTRPTPITMHTEIADYVANITAEENRDILRGSRLDNKNEVPSNPLPPAQVDTDWEIIPCKKRKLMNNLNKLDASTSTLDLEKSSTGTETSSSDKKSDQYVYLPSGGVVCLEPKDSSDPVPLDEAFKKLVPNIKGEENSDLAKYSIKQVYKSNEVLDKLQRRFINQEEVQQNQIMLKSQQNKKKTTSTRTKPKYEPPVVTHPTPKPVDNSPQYNCDMKSLKHPPLYIPPISDHSHLMIQHTPVPPEHLYAVDSTSSGKSKPYSRPTSSWVRKQNLSAPKPKKITSRSQPTTYQPSSEIRNTQFMGYPKPQYTSHSKKIWSNQLDDNRRSVSSLTSRIDPGIPTKPLLPPSYLPEEQASPIHINDALFSNVETKTEPSAPQLILRPKIRMPGVTSSSQPILNTPVCETSPVTPKGPDQSLFERQSSESLQIPHVAQLSSGYNPSMISTDVVTVTASQKPNTLLKPPTTESTTTEREAEVKRAMVSKPALVQGINTNIIKVSARSVTSNKVIPIVAQLSGTRIMKTTTTSTPRSKPNIIVVHRPTPAKPKFLEVDGKGSKPVVSTTVISSTVESTSSRIGATVMKSVPTKLVSVPTSVRKITGNTISSEFPKTVHKVIRKRNLQQVVFKPSASVLSPTSVSTSVPSSFSVIKPTYKSSTTANPKAMGVPKTIKPIMTFKNSVTSLTPSKVVPIQDIQESSGQSHMTLSPSVLHPNPKLLMRKHRQRLVTINSSKDKVTTSTTLEEMEQ